MSRFKHQTREKVKELVKDLIFEETGLPRTSKNFQIAFDFIMNNLSDHTFLAPNSH